MEPSWFFKMVNKTDKTSARLKENERAQINKIRSEKEVVNTNTTEIQRIVRDYCQQLYANKIQKLDEIDKSLKHIIPGQNPREKQNLGKTNYQQ